MAVRKTGFFEYKGLIEIRKPSVPTPVFGGFRGTAVFCKNPIHAINGVGADRLVSSVHRLTSLMLWDLLVVKDPVARIPGAIIPHFAASQPTRKRPGAHKPAAESVSA